MTRARNVSNPQAIDIPLTVSANLTANAVITVGNSSVNSVITSNTYSIGSNVSLNTSRLFLGNSTVNSVHTASTLDVGANVNLSTVGLNVGSNTVNAYINSTSFAIGNSTVNTAITSTTITSTALLSIGNTNVTGTANVSTGINVGANVNLSTTYIDVGNSTVNTTITNITVSTNTVNVASIINVGANVSANTTALRVGNSTVNTSITSTALTTTSNTITLGTAAYVVANGNVGIGTASPGSALDVLTATNGIVAKFKSSSTYGTVTADNGSATGGGSFSARLNGTQYALFGVTGAIEGTSGTDAGISATGVGGAIKFYTNQSTTHKATIDSSGNLGLGVTPSATSSGVKSFEMQGVGSGLVSFGSVDTVVTAGAFYSSTGWKYAVSSSAVSYYYQSAGKHQWFNAASGTANNLFTATQAMTLDASGNLLVGTTTINRLGSGATGPAFHLATSSGAEIYLSTSATTSGEFVGAINFGTTGTSSATKRSALIGSLLTATSSSVVSGNMVIYTNSAGTLAERMRIGSTGGIGIGQTTTDSALLHLDGNVSNATFPYGLIYASSGGVGGGASAPQYGLYFDIKSYNNASSMTGIYCKVAQNVGGPTYAVYGQTYPSAASTWGGYFKATQGDTNGGGIASALTGETTTSIGVANTGYGIAVTAITDNYVNNIGILINSTYTGGSGQTAVRITRNSSNIGAITTTTTATAYVTSSDYRLKEDITPMTGALAKVSQLNPVTYKWKIDGSNGQGFIAHELQTFVPECVHGEKDAVDADDKPIYQGVDTSFLVATLTAAIQEQQALITQLQADVAELKSR
jgi:hypothetical protein